MRVTDPWNDILMVVVNRMLSLWYHLVQLCGIESKLMVGITFTRTSMKWVNGYEDMAIFC
jgi:hypothetical protein